MISTCIPTYNGECYIEQQLISILSQMGSNDEVIISDDSSTDKTLDIINSINDPRVRMFQGNKYYNPTHNLENALKTVLNNVINNPDNIIRDAIGVGAGPNLENVAYDTNKAPVGDVPKGNPDPGNVDTTLYVSVDAVVAGAPPAVAVVDADTTSSAAAVVIGITLAQ